MKYLGYDGYSIIGGTELNDFWKERMERATQKAELQDRIINSIKEANQLFEAYLEHSHATISIPNHHKQILDSINVPIIVLKKHFWHISIAILFIIYEDKIKKCILSVFF